MLRLDSYTQAPGPGHGMRDIIEVYWDDSLVFTYNRNWHVVGFFACVFSALFLYGALR